MTFEDLSKHAASFLARADSRGHNMQRSSILQGASETRATWKCTRCGRTVIVIVKRGGEVIVDGFAAVRDC